MHKLLIQIQCKPGTTYKVADKIYTRMVEELKIATSLYSISGEFDLFLEIWIPKDQEIGKYINDNLLDIDGIERTVTTMAFHAF
jgi:DNA-binding Lrp family transcriptional regulator